MKKRKENRTFNQHHRVWDKSARAWVSLRLPQTSDIIGKKENIVFGRTLPPVSARLAPEKNPEKSVPSQKTPKKSRKTPIYHTKKARALKGLFRTHPLWRCRQHNPPFSVWKRFEWVSLL
jgi:hypothetical protein